MCKFHEDVARDIATRADGTFDPHIYAVNLAVLGTLFSIKDYVPAMPDISGFDTYELASEYGRISFAVSGLVYDAAKFTAYRDKTRAVLQEKTRQVLEAYPLKEKSFARLQSKRSGVYYMNKAPDEMYDPFEKGFDASLYPTRAQAEKYNQLRHMAADYGADPVVRDILTERFKQSVATVFTEAQEKVSPTILKIYEKLPPKLRLFNSCAGGICSAAGGSFVGHLGCVIKFGVLPALGGATGIAHDPALMYGLMGGGTALGLGLSEYLPYRKGGVPSKLQRMMTYGTALVTLAGFTAYHELSGDHDHHAGHGDNVTYFRDDAGNRFMVQQKVLCGERTLPDGTRVPVVKVLPPDTTQYWLPEDIDKSTPSKTQTLTR